MSRRKSEGMIAMSLFKAFFITRILLIADSAFTKKIDKLSVAITTVSGDNNPNTMKYYFSNFIYTIVSCLGVGATYGISRPAFRKNVSRLDAIIRKH